MEFGEKINIQLRTNNVANVIWHSNSDILSIENITYLSPPSISKLKSSEKKVSVSWNKTNGATGYVVYMATSKNGKYSKIATLKGNSKVSYTKTGLTKGKTYYFKVAAYTVANGKTLYSSFSSVKAVKIK